jgi:hypothetical protein
MTSGPKALVPPAVIAFGRIIPMNMNVFGSVKVSAICPHLKPWAVSYEKGKNKKREARGERYSRCPCIPV